MFKFNGVSIDQDVKSRTITISQPDSLKNIEQITLARARSKESNHDIINIERNQYRSIIGSLLWHGTQTVPHLLFLASSMARKTEQAKVKHLKTANANIKYARFFNTDIKSQKRIPILQSC